MYFVRICRAKRQYISSRLLHKYGVEKLLLRKSIQKKYSNQLIISNKQHFFGGWNLENSIERLFLDLMAGFSLTWNSLTNSQFNNIHILFIKKENELNFEVHSIFLSLEMKSLELKNETHMKPQIIFHLIGKHINSMKSNDAVKLEMFCGFMWCLQKKNDHYNSTIKGAIQIELSIKI